VPDDVQATADTLDALSHVPQPEMARCADDLSAADRQPDAIVGDLDRHETAADLDPDTGVLGARVFRDVDERFLQGLLEDVSGHRRQALEVAVEGEVDGTFL
jgi:hypothetical protein